MKNNWQPPKLETNIFELIVLLSCVSIPMFILANELSGDEIVKASTGVALGTMTAGILAAYKLWKLER